MALLSFDDIAGAEDVGEEILPIPEWGGEVKVRGLSRFELKEIRRVATTKVAKGQKEINSEIFEKGIIFYGLVHPQIDDQKYDVMLQKSSGAVQKIIDKIMELSKLADDEDEAEEGLKREEQSFHRGSESVSGVSARRNTGRNARAVDDGSSDAAE